MGQSQEQRRSGHRTPADTGTIHEPIPETDNDRVDEQLACSIADEVRSRQAEMWRRSLDKPEFRAAGGSDAALDLLADLEIISVYRHAAAVCVIGERLGLPVDEPEQRQRIRSEHPGLVRRVHELVLDRCLPEVDDDLASELVAIVPARIRARQADYELTKGSEYRTSHVLPPPSAAEIEASAERALSQASTDQCASVARAALADRLGMPDHHALAPHPTIVRTLELMGKIRPVDLDEVERLRPQVPSDPQAQRLARTIVARLEPLMRNARREVLRDLDPQLGPAELEAKAAESAAQDLSRPHRIVDLSPSVRGPGLGRVDDSIDSAIDSALGGIALQMRIDRLSPAMLVAESMIPGMASSYEMLIRDHAMSPADAAARIVSSSARAAATPVSPASPGLNGPIRRRASAPPAFQPINLTARHLGGHPGLASGSRPLLVMVTTVGAGVFADRRAKREVAAIEYDKVRSIRVEGPEQADSRVTVPRMAAMGVFAFAKKKQVSRSYLIFEPYEGGDVTFEIDGHNVWELRGMLSPLLAHFEQDGN